MPISVSRKLQALQDLKYPDLQIEVHPVALTLDQVTAYGLPSSTLKDTERRADKWKAVWGRAQTEIDALIALHPGAVRDLAKKAISPFYDLTLKRRAQELADAWVKQARQEMLSSENYPVACAAIEKALEGVSAAVNTLKMAQADAVAMLPQLEKLIRTPELIIAATAPTPLFTTHDDYRTASLRLISVKQLDGSAP